MSISYKSIYSDSSVKLQRDPSITATEGISMTATNFLFVGGSTFSLQLPISMSAHGGLNIQGNNSNYFDSTITGTYKISINPILNQPGMGNKRTIALNSSFSANWITFTTIPNGSAFQSVSGVPVRYMRLSGAGLSAANFAAYLWTDNYVEGA